MTTKPAAAEPIAPEAHESTLRAIVGAGFDEPFTKMSEAASVSVLQGRWGADWKEKLEVVQAATEKLGDEFREYLDQSGRGNDPRTIQALYDYAMAQQPPAASAEAVPLTLPAGLPATQIPDDFQEQMSEYSAAASAAGLDARTQQRLLDVMVNETLDFPSTALDFHDAVSEIQQRWGADAPRRHAVVARTVAKLGPAFAEYLRSSNRGNDPNVLEALYQYGSGNLSLSPAEAQKRLDKIYADPKHAYWKPGSTFERKRVTAEVRLLSSIANEASAPAVPRRGADAVAEKAKENDTASSNARAEAAKILSETKNFTAGTVQERAAAKARFMELTAKMAGGA